MGVGVRVNVNTHECAKLGVILYKGAIPLGVFVCLVIFEIRSLNWDPGLDQLANEPDHLALCPQL